MLTFLIFEVVFSKPASGMTVENFATFNKHNPLNWLARSWQAAWKM
jgi:hypothetical protein